MGYRSTCLGGEAAHLLVSRTRNETSKPPAPTAMANSHSFQLCWVVLKKLLMGVYTMRICVLITKEWALCDGL